MCQIGIVEKLVILKKPKLFWIIISIDMNRKSEIR